MKRALNDLTREIIGAAISVHHELGPGMLESAYEACLCYELSKRGIQFRRQVDWPIQYDSVRLDVGLRLDLLSS